MSLNVEQFTVNLFGESTFVVWDDATRQAMIIDPGMAKPQEAAMVDQFIEQSRLDLKYLANTHLHLDHCFGNSHVEQRYGLASMAHQSDFELGANIPAQAAMFHLRGEFVSPAKLTPIDEQSVFTLGEEQIRVLHVPGHTPGSVAFYAPKAAWVISGDALFCGSIGRTDLPGGNYAQLVRSISDKLLTLPPETIVYPGHGPSTTVAAELSGNPYL